MVTGAFIFFTEVRLKISSIKIYFKIEIYHIIVKNKSFLKTFYLHFKLL